MEEEIEMIDLIITIRCGWGVWANHILTIGRKIGTVEHKMYLIFNIIITKRTYSELSWSSSVPSSFNCQGKGAGSELSENRSFGGKQIHCKVGF